MTEQKTYSRSDLIKMKAVTSAQIDYLAKLKIVEPDVGNKRKRFSQEEAALAIISGAILRFGFLAPNLVEPIKWLRGQINDTATNGFRDNLRMACNESPPFAKKPLYINIFADEDLWRCKWSNDVSKLDDAAMWQTMDLKMIFDKLKFEFV